MRTSGYSLYLALLLMALPVLATEPAEPPPSSAPPSLGASPPADGDAAVSRLHSVSFSFACTREAAFVYQPGTLWPGLGGVVVEDDASAREVHQLLQRLATTWRHGHARENARFVALNYRMQRVGLLTLKQGRTGRILISPRMMGFMDLVRAYRAQRRKIEPPLRSTTSWITL